MEPAYDANGLNLESPHKPHDIPRDGIAVDVLPAPTRSFLAARCNGSKELVKSGLPAEDVEAALQKAMAVSAHPVWGNPSAPAGSEPVLYLGSLEAASDVALLRRLGVRRIVNCLRESDAAPEVLHSGGEFEVLSLNLEDEEDAASSHMTLDVLERACRFLDSPAAPGPEASTPALASTASMDADVPSASSCERSASDIGGAHVLPCSALVHCQAGVSRSAAVVLAYLLLHRRFGTAAEALSHVQRCRPIADPNLGFRRLLFLLERKLAGAGSEDLEAWSAELSRAAAASAEEEAAAYASPPRSAFARRSSVTFISPEGAGESSSPAPTDAMRRRRSLRRTSVILEEIRAAALAAQDALATGHK